MPDDSPVETRSDDGLRTDNSSQPDASTGLPDRSPLADGVGSPADTAPPDVIPAATSPASTVAEEAAADTAAANGSSPALAPETGGGNGSAPADRIGSGGGAPPASAAGGQQGSQVVRSKPSAMAGSVRAEEGAAPGADGTAAGTGYGVEDAGRTASTGDGADPPVDPPVPGEPGGDADDSGPKQARGRRGSFLRELPILLVVAFGLALLIKTFLVQAFFIPSGSMEKTLHGCTGCSGDRVLVNKLVYRFHDPRPGDVVVFRGPESWAPEAQFSKPSNVVQKVFRAIGSAVGVAPAGEKDFVKRVIAVGGQTVQCCDTQGRVVVDGRPLNEPYVYISDPDYRSQPFGPIKVPPGRLWMMGDHRDESADSRVHISDSDQGTIGVSDVIGKAFVIVWPPSRWATLGTPSTFASAAPAVAPYVLGAGLVLPVGLVRRRRRRGR